MSGYDSGIDLPKPATASTGPVSIFQLCNNIYKRLGCVSDAIPFLDKSKKELEQDPSYNPIMGIDPVSLIWNALRMGSPLSIMYNVLDSKDPLKVTPIEDADLRKAKASVYHFLLKCKNNLGLQEEELFSITDLFKDDTNAFIKVLKNASLLLDRMEHENLIDCSDLDLDYNQSSGPKDNRAKVVMELLQTERKYIQDLEKLQNYMQEIQESKLLSSDTTHFLFANLHNLVDFQRRFLICVECNALLPPEEQRFGGLFLTMEDAFSVYEPFCANYGKASSLAVKEAPTLQQLTHVMEPNYELPSYLIKPIQRICKYPLLLRELIRYTEEEDYPYFFELKLGMKAIERVAAKVNEMRRKEENTNTCEDLKNRVINWDRLSVDDFGELLQYDKVIVVGMDQKERERSIFIFTNALICCKELSLSSRRAKQASKKAIGPPLELCEHIPAKNVVKIADKNNDGEYFIRVYWRLEVMQILILKCRNEEQVRLWKTPLESLVSNRDSSKRDSAESNQYSNKNNNMLGVPSALPPNMQNEQGMGYIRNRSASSPNIYAQGVPSAKHYPHLAKLMNQNNNNQNSNHSPERSPTPMDKSSSHHKVKLHYRDELFVVLIPHNVNYEDLVYHIERKLSTFGNSNRHPNSESQSPPAGRGDRFRVRYQDIDGDYITINTDEDVQLAYETTRGDSLENRGGVGATLNLYID